MDAFYPLVNIPTLHIYLIPFQTREYFTQKDSDPFFITPKHAKNSGLSLIRSQTIDFRNFLHNLS